MADTMISFSNNNLSEHFLTNDDLRAACPHAFKQEPTNPNASGKYVQANTMTVIDDLAKLGSEKAVREAGLLRTEGKTYIMQDGDVVEFKFNV